MFAVVRTGGKQYRVAPGDKIVVEKLAGEAGQQVDITDVLLAGEGSELRSVEGLTVAAEIIAQAKGDKVTVFKKRRRHNYRRKKGHRQQHTILRIVAIGDQKAEKKPAAKPAAAKAPKPGDSTAAPVVEEQETPNPAPNDEAKADPDKAKAKKAAPAAKPAKATKAAAAKPAKAASTKNAAPAKGAAKPKTPKAK
ncbi:MAG TPA: 50S ribosomal protein L21 [Sphingomicrobium sp.]|nr:50S ribosomal protein L21 [Sphingomicrobium sp.]